MEKDDRAGGRLDREIEAEDEGDAGRVMETQEIR